MTPSQHQENKRAPSTGGKGSQFMIEELLEQKIEELCTKIAKLMASAPTKLDPEETYIPPQTTLIQLLATGKEVDEALLKLHRMNSEDGVSLSEEEFLEATQKIDNFMRNIDSEETPRILVEPENGVNKKGAEAVVAQVQEMAEGFTDFISHLREFNVLKGYLRALFTPGNTIRERMTARNCLPSGPVLVYLSEARMRFADLPRSESETAWIACAFMPAGTIQYILRWNKETKKIDKQRSTNIGVSPDQMKSISMSARMNYFAQERLFFFSDTDLPLHPVFFEKPFPESDAFEWAEDIQKDFEVWDSIVHNIVPKLPQIFGSLENGFEEMKTQDETAAKILPLLKKHRPNLENPEFFLEFILTLSALPRNEGVGMLDGMGGIVSGLMRSILGR